MDGTILVADDDRTIRTVLTQALTRAGCKVHATASLTTLLRWVEEGKGDLVISDVMMPDGNGLNALPQIAKLRPDLPVIVISAQNTIMTAIKAAEAEAFDYLPKPFDLPDLLKRCARALGQKHAALPVPPREMAEDLALVGRSPVMQVLYQLVAKVVNSDLAVMISGESGAGKSLIARAIHDNSDRRNQPFVVAHPDDLTDTTALLARVKSGSLMFDEIADFDADAQSRITRLLESLGESAPRIMAATQADLGALMAEGRFRPDLFYRLSGVALQVPPLRDRGDDIALLSDHFLQRGAQEMGFVRSLAAPAHAVLRKHHWPGNVRQLENTMRRLLATGTAPEITRAEVELILPQQAEQPVEGSFSAEKLSASVARHLQRYFDLHGQALPPFGVYARVLKEFETPLLEIALDATGGNQAKCAELLGINRNTLRKKITELEINVTRRRKLM